MTDRHSHTLPWMFCRDEIDLLEEGFDAVLRRHDGAKRSARWGMEEEILREQFDTEDGQPGSGTAPEPPVGAGCAHDVLSSGEKLRERLRHDVARDPLYERAYLWGARVSRWARTRYEAHHEKDASRFVYRALVNAPLVAAKISFALAEESHEHEDDDEGVDFARDEYDLAVTYLSRARESLQSVWERVEPSADVGWMVREAHTLAAQIDHARRRLAPPGIPTGK